MLTDEEIGAISCMNLGVYDYARTIERAVLAKAMPIPKQEPVAWMNNQGETTINEVQVEYWEIGGYKITPLYTGPQPAQAAANPLVGAVFAASHKKAADTLGKCPHCSHECAQAAAMQEWKPINSAPKGGEMILLYVPLSDSNKFHIGAYRFRDGYWWTDSHNFVKSPSHWMTLPDTSMLSSSPKPE